MKLTAQECFFVVQALNNVQIKASDAIFVSGVINKFNKELQKQAKAEGLDLPAEANPLPATQGPGAGMVPPIKDESIPAETKTK